MANPSDHAATAVEYHYDLQRENRQTVRKQGTAINKSLKKLRSISSSKVPIPTAFTRGDEPTQQHITIPHSEPEMCVLKEALVAAEAQCRKSDTPPAEVSTVRIRRKRWFGWKD